MKKLRLIELFSGYGSQYIAFKNCNIPIEHYKISDWGVNATKLYKIFNSKDNTNYSKGIKKKDLISNLLALGISLDGKTFMQKKELQLKEIQWLRDTYNAFMQTNNLGSITNIHVVDLQLTQTNKYDYVVTYSFPCQDLSRIGTKQGLIEGNKSNLLWEVKRLLSEIKENALPLPKYLIMENVPQITTTYKNDFEEWKSFLQTLGYTNTQTIINSIEFLPQNRKRCFLVSVLGEGVIFSNLPKKRKYSIINFLDKDDFQYLPKQKEEKLLAITTLPKKLEKTDVVIIDNTTGYSKQSRVYLNKLPTIRSKRQGFVIYTNKGCRYLSIKEYARFMGILDESVLDNLCNSEIGKTYLLELLGNSIVIPVMEYVLREIFKN